MTAALRNLDIVLDALERGESPSVVILPDPSDAACHPGKPGTDWRYCRGCRCGACRAAHTVYRRTWKQTRAAASLAERLARVEMRAAILRSRMTDAERAAS